MKIIIFGGSGSGTTTLAQSLAEKLQYEHLDVDEFYWVQTIVPYQIKIARSQRVNRLRKALEASENVVVSGSLVNWGEYWSSAFDLGVLLYLPPDVRMERLRKREVMRYGDQLQSDPDLKAQSEEFLNWAQQYDNPSFDGRNIAEHKKWAKSLNCHCLEIGDLSNEQRISEVLKAMKLHEV